MDSSSSKSSRLVSLGAYRAPMYPPETPAEELPKFLTMGQVSFWLGFSIPKIYRMVRAGDFHTTPSSADKRMVLFERDEVVRFRATDPRFVTSMEYVRRAAKGRGEEPEEG